MYDARLETNAAQASQPPQIAFHDHHPGQDSFKDALLAGLSRPKKSIPCRFLYDARGSALFDQICELPEYYPTRTETGILRAKAGEIAAAMGRGVELIELGSGSSAKVRILLDALQAPEAYIPIDISRDHLRAAAEALQADYPAVRVEAVCADYDQAFDLPAQRGEGRRVGFYPGSTIGNLEPADAELFLARWARRLGAGALLLVGVDLKKSAEILIPAYDDPQGVTASFSKNLLVRANRELGANFDTRLFRHVVDYDPQSGRVGIHLISLANQEVRFAGRVFTFAQGEAVHVENSNKYSLEGFKALAASAGYRSVACWTDAGSLFSVHLLEVAPLTS